MKTEEEFLEELREMDPDYVVDVLEISSDTLVDVFLDRAIRLYEEEWGD